MNSDYLPSIDVLKNHGFGAPISSRQLDALTWPHPTGALFIDFGGGAFSLVDEHNVPIFRLHIFSDAFLDAVLTSANLSERDADEVAAAMNVLATTAAEPLSVG